MLGAKRTHHAQQLCAAGEQVLLLHSLVVRGSYNLEFMQEESLV